jgi:hypothetical protein
VICSKSSRLSGVRSLALVNLSEKHRCLDIVEEDQIEGAITHDKAVHPSLTFWRVQGRHV